MSKYAIWDKQSPVITPSGEVFTAAQWKERYPVATLDSVKVVCGGGEINGAFFGTLGSMVEMYTAQGADFSGATTDEEKLAVIEAFETADHSDGESSPEERIASALELNNMLQMPTIHDDDPDLD